MSGGQYYFLFIKEIELNFVHKREKYNYLLLLF